jgi:hypothetical protein
VGCAATAEVSARPETGSWAVTHLPNSFLFDDQYDPKPAAGSCLCKQLDQAQQQQQLQLVVDD